MSFAYVVPARGSPQVAYRIDNEREKGIHEHVGSVERARPVQTWQSAAKRFLRRVRALERARAP
ncbi:MAG: hypothetical protein ACYDCK_02220 [Thermoplasmatota archaeon]